MRTSMITLFMAFCLSAVAQNHQFSLYNACFKSDGITGSQFDGEEEMFINDTFEAVFTFPFIEDTNALVLPTYLKHFAESNRTNCLKKIKMLIDKEVNITETEDPPEITVYTKDFVDTGHENKLICFVNHFYPPMITVSWTKNNMPITDGGTQSRYFINTDATFHVFSTLDFTPQEGDIYGCTVEHQALAQPKTQIWALPVQDSSVGLSVLCGVGVGLGLLGIFSSIFLIVKGLGNRTTI